MPILNYSESFTIGTTGSTSIELDDTNRLIKFNGGLLNKSGTKHQLTVIKSSLGNFSTMSSANSIVIFDLTDNLTVSLGTQQSGRTFYFRRIDSGSNLLTIQRAGTDTIRLGSTTSVTSFTMSADQSRTLVYSGSTWFLSRDGGSNVGSLPAPAPPPGPPPGPPPPA